MADVQINLNDYSKVQDAEINGIPEDRDAIVNLAEKFGISVSGSEDELAAAVKLAVKLKLCEEAQSHIDKADNIITILGGSDSTEKPEIFHKYQGELWTGKYVGFLEFPIKEEGKEERRCKIAIHSRFDSRMEKPFFLYYIFQKAFDESGKIFKDMELGADLDQAWDLLLLLLFFEQMREAFKKGMHRKYQSFSYNDTKPKGCIDVARQIRENPLPNGRIAYNMREYSVKNDYNRLFLQAFYLLRRKYPGPCRSFLANNDVIREGIGFLERELAETRADKKLSLLKKTEKKIVNPLYRNYEALRKTSRAIIRRLGVDFREGEGKVSGVLIDIAALWEKFIAATILDQGWEQQFSFPVLGGRRIFKPDFFHKEKRVVLDAKYRKSWEDTLAKDNAVSWNDGIRGDVFQVFAYMLSLRCHTGGILFPVKGENWGKRDQSSWDVQEFIQERLSVFPPEESGETRQFIRIPIPIEMDEGYAEFSNKMDEKISQIKDNVNKALA